MKFLVPYHWVGTIYLHVIEIENDNMVIDISYKVTLGRRNNIVQLRKWNPMFNHSLNIALI